MPVPAPPALSLPVLDSLFTNIELYSHLLAVLLGMPRLFVIAQTVPFMAPSIITGQMRTILVCAIYMPLHFVVQSQLSAALTGDIIADGIFFSALILKEILIGLLLAFLICIPFYAMMSAGFLVDNQRGASMASGSEPASGQQTTPLGSFLLQTMFYVFYTGGGFLAFLVTLYGSYELWPIANLIPLDWPMEVAFFFAKQVSWLLLYMLLLAGPIVVACLMADMSLGLVNRFASQLNVYVLAMPVKSAMAAFLLVSYYAVLLQKIPFLLNHFTSSVNQLHRLLP